MNFELTTIDWQTIATIASVATLIFLYLNISELVKQRKSMYRPMLCIPNINFMIEKDKTGLPNIWIRALDQKNIGLPPIVDIQLLNVGLAAALNVKITWLLDISNITKNFNELIESGNKKISKRNKPNDFQYFYETNIPHQYGFIINKDVEVSYYSVINKEGMAELRIPDQLFNYISYYLYEKFISRGNNREEEKINLPIRIKMEYYDLGNTKIDQELFCEIESIRYNDNMLAGNKIAIVKFIIIDKKHR